MKANTDELRLMATDIEDSTPRVGGAAKADAAAIRDAADELDQLRTERKQLWAAVEKQRAIIERLPKTADGVPVVPGMFVWGGVGGDDDNDPYLVTGVINYAALDEEFDEEAQQAFYHAGNDCHHECDAATDTSSCYSTLEAALAARKEQQ